MAATRLFGVALSAGVTTDVCTISAPVNVAYSVNICNESNSPVEVSFWDTATGTPASGELIIPGRVVAPRGEHERTGLIGMNGRHLVFLASAAGITVTGYGYTE